MKAMKRWKKGKKEREKEGIQFVGDIETGNKNRKKKRTKKI